MKESNKYIIVATVLVFAGITMHYLFKALLPDAIGVSNEDREILEEIKIESETNLKDE